jgi:glycosyltransferase involved in cell wall biosynthesis
VSWIPEVSRLVVYTNFGKRVLEECVTALRAEGAPFPVPDIAVIPHGTATDRFYPHPSGDIGMSPTGRRAIARQALFPVGNLADDAFIVLNACHNQPRKRIDLTVEGFALFARNKPNNVHLYLHMGMKEVGWNVVALAKEAGIENRLLVTAPSRSHPWVSDDRLNLIYNACDVGINTASAEGWGLVSFEHAATEAAQVVPRHGACEELWADAAVMVEPTRRERAGLFLGASIVSPEGVANGLEILYQDRAYLCAMSQAAYANATKAMYRWENIAKVWKDLLDQALHSKRPLVGRGNR